MSFCSFVASDDGMLFLLGGLNFETASFKGTNYSHFGGKRLLLLPKTHYPDASVGNFI